MSTQARGRFCGDAAIAQYYVQYSDSVEDGQEQLSSSFHSRLERSQFICKDILKSLVFHVFSSCDNALQTALSQF